MTSVAAVADALAAAGVSSLATSQVESGGLDLVLVRGSARLALDVQQALAQTPLRGAWALLLKSGGATGPTLSLFANDGPADADDVTTIAEALRDEMLRMPTLAELVRTAATLEAIGEAGEVYTIVGCGQPATWYSRSVVDWAGWRDWGPIEFM